MRRAAATLEFLAAIRLRTAQPELPRPYRIPLSTTPLCLMLALPMACSLVVCYVTLIESATIIGAGLACGLLLYVPFACGWRSTIDVASLSRAASEATQNPMTGALLRTRSSTRGGAATATNLSARHVRTTGTDE